MDRLRLVWRDARMREKKICSHMFQKSEALRLERAKERTKLSGQQEN